MTKEYKCESCQKSFIMADALQQHNRSKHPEKIKQPLVTQSAKKKIVRGVVIIAILGLMVWGVAALLKKDAQSLFAIDLGSTAHIPTGAVHWHPKITISIDGKEQQIPVGIGVDIGKRIDSHLSGMGMSPTHTHESDGTIHLENNNPSSKPETTSLGYFFHVWDKQFSKECIFEYCTDKGALKMTVNGKENNEFGRYLMKDKDEIRIEYITTQN